MNIGEVVEWAGLSETTIRNYLKEFGDIDGGFSASATPERGRHRRFTNRDVSIVAWISCQYGENHLSTEDIRLALAERIKNDEPFEEPPRPEDEAALAVITREQHEEIIAAHMRSLDIARAERDAFEGLLQQERREKDQLHDRIAQLNREIGRLEEQVRNLGGDA